MIAETYIGVLRILERNREKGTMVVGEIQPIMKAKGIIPKSSNITKIMQILHEKGYVSRHGQDYSRFDYQITASGIIWLRGQKGKIRRLLKL